MLYLDVDVKAKTGVRPPSTNIYVVDPETLHWTVSGENWNLQTGKQYSLAVTLTDTHGNGMFIGNVSESKYRAVLELLYRFCLVAVLF